MPNRIIREGFLDSATINNLPEKEQNFFVRLMLVADDHGRFDARSELVKSRCYPVTDKRPSDVSKMLTTLNSVGLIKLYSVKNKNYLEINNYNQRLRQKIEKYPSPVLSDDSIVLTSDSDMPLEEKRREVEENIYKKFAHLKLSTKDFEKLKLSYSKQKIDSILTKIENYRQNKKYKSLYLTALDWLKREHGKQKESFDSTTYRKSLEENN